MKPKDNAGNRLSKQFIENLSRCVARSRNNPQDVESLNELQVLRTHIAQFWITADTSRLKYLYSSKPGQACRLLLTSQVLDNPLNAQDEAFSVNLYRQIVDLHNKPDAIKYIIALTLYKPADKAPGEILESSIPPWFIDDFVTYLLRPKMFFNTLGEVDRYRNFMEKTVGHFHNLVFKEKYPILPATGSSEHRIATSFTRYFYAIPLYFGKADLKEIMLKRAQLAEAAQVGELTGNAYIHTNQTNVRKRIRLGILSAHYNPQTETYATLPVYEFLDRNRFEIILYGSSLGGHPLENYCRARAEKLVLLPANINEQLQTIRDDELDILFISSNITAVNTDISQLAIHRMAPVQVTSICSPVTTGIQNTDCYIAGDLTVNTLKDQSHYIEKLTTINGSGLCFSFPEENKTAEIKPDRSQIGIPDDAVIFVSGANYFKITPELRETWAQIIASVPDSLLILYPFNPYWSRSYKAGPFLAHMHKLFEKHGIDLSRLVILNPFPSRADIKSLLEICDIYLDAFPYGGATSIIDPLETGLPPVVVEGDFLRFRQASAILRELQIPDLITENEDNYIELAIKLGRDKEQRERYRNLIALKISENPAFLDSAGYAKKIGTLFETLWQEYAGDTDDSMSG